MQLALPPKAASTSALHTAPSPSASPTRPQPPALTSMGRLQDSRALPCAGYAVFCPRRTELPDPCGVAPDHWIQGPVRRVSSPSFPSQSRVTASTLRAPPLYRWSLRLTALHPQREPGTLPLCDGGLRLVTHRAVPRHIPLPVSPAPNHVPLLDLPPSPGAPVHPNPYLRGSTRACGRGWR